MQDAFALRLSQLTTLNREALEALTGLFSTQMIVPAGRSLAAEGKQPGQLHLLIDGLAARAKWLPDGSRYLSAVLIPGDVCDIDALHVRHYDYSVIALSPSTVATADRLALLALCDAQPDVARVLTWLGFVDNAMLNEAAVSLARRSARGQLAHLLCELNRRLGLIVRTSADGYDLPLSQEQLGDALGLTGVHVNRVLRDLRENGLATFAGRRVTVPDWTALEQMAGFSPGYLHLDGIRARAA